MKSVNIIFPNQLFKQSDLLDNTYPIYLVEENLFFNHYQFHKQKLAFHRASMQFYNSYLKDLGKTVHYISAVDSNSDIRRLLKKLIDEASLDEQTDLNSKLEDLAWDSLAVITAIAVFDEVYSITLNAEDLDGCKNLQDIVNLSKR